MKGLRRISGVMMTVALLCLFILAVAADSPSDSVETTVLFTQDLHSHFLPQKAEDGGESGGYARLKTVLDGQRTEYPNALVLDGGDFSIGSLIQTLYTTKAAELRTMGALDYDATTVGNHEFDHTGVGFAQMLNAATLSGDKLPALLMANYKPDRENPDQLNIQRAMAAYGVQDYMRLERGGVTYGIFGLMGEDSHVCAPTSGFELGDLADNAQRCVDALKEQGAEFIICLSHSGTNEVQKKSEDEQLAKAVDGIDLIISGHTHTTLEEPIVVGDTYIVSAGAHCENLGSITIRGSGAEKELVRYQLIPIDETIAPNTQIATLIERWKAQVGSSYLSAYDLTYDQVLTKSGFDLSTPQSGVQQGNALGELVADAYRWAAEQAEGEDYQEAIAVTADGVLRSNLYVGELTTTQAFDVLSMGVGGDGLSGYPLVSVWLTGKELEAALEVDASVAPIMPAAQLYFSGMTYSFNTHRMFFNRVMEAEIGDRGQGLELEKDRLYRVVTGMYCAQMLGSVKDKSMGLLSLEPKDAQGQLITDFNEHIIYDQHGNEVKEWYALASYLASFGEDGVPSRYSTPDGRKVVSHSWSPVQLLKNLNWITLVSLLVLVLFVALVVMIVRGVRRMRRRRHYGGSYRRKYLFWR